jgi:hypothetical protein
MTGATAVAFSPTTVIDITKFYLSAAAVGTVTLHEDAEGGTTLATIRAGATNSRYRRIALVPTPSAAVTYTIDYERNIADLVNGTDEPVLPEKFHYLLGIGGRMKEYEKIKDLSRWTLAKQEYESGLKKLKFWIYQQTVGAPNLRGFAFTRPSISDGGTLAQAGASSSPTSVTDGGTGFSSYTIGDLLVADTTTSLAKITAVADGRVLRAAGAGVVPAYSTFSIADIFAANRIPYATATNVLGSSANLTFNGTTLALTGAQTISTTLAVTGIITGRDVTVISSTTTGATNNWDPGIVTGTTFIQASGAALAATGLEGGTSGCVVVIRNTGSGILTFAHASASSDADNRFTNAATSAPTPVAAGGYIIYIHDGTNWDMVAHDQGAWITPTFSAGNYTGSASMTWTVDAGDVNTQRYALRNKDLHVHFDIATTTVGGTPNTQLRIGSGAFGSFTFAATDITAGWAVDNGTAANHLVIASSNEIANWRTDTGNWSASTNNTRVAGSICGEVT